jgi:putative membrane protein
MNTTSPNNLPSSKYRKLVVAVSIIIPIAVAALFGIKIEGVDLSFLPPFYATLNGVTAILLISALAFIKTGNMKLHQRTIQVCLGISLLFLVCYVAYHMTSDTTLFGDLNHDGVVDSNIGSIKYVYYFILASHILLSIAVIPLVLFTYLFALEGNYTKHKKYTRFAFPIWLYVAVTGVVVYWMISPYYVH